MGEAQIAGLVRDGQLRQARPDPETARGELLVARRHVESAKRLVEDDPTLAFVALYDAMRKASVALDHLGIDVHLGEFDALRDLRNQSEYDALWVRPEDVHATVAHATAIPDAVTADLMSA